MNPRQNRWEWAKDRLATLPTWRLLWAMVTPVGLAAFWFTLHLREGDTVWAVVFGLLLGLSIVIEVAAVALRIARRRQLQPRKS